MRVVMINTGTELLLGDVLNSHLSFIAREIFPLGLRVERQITVPDGEAIRYVIYRQEAPRSHPQASMIRRQSDGGWLFVASRDLLMIDPTAAFRTEFTPKPDLEDWR